MNRGQITTVIRVVAPFLNPAKEEEVLSRMYCCDNANTLLREARKLEKRDKPYP